MLALSYGLRGNTAEAARLSRIDLDDRAVEQNLAYYQTLRGLSPRSRAIMSAAPSSGQAKALQFSKINRFTTALYNAAGIATSTMALPEVALSKWRLQELHEGAWPGPRSW